MKKVEVDKLSGVDLSYVIAVLLNLSWATQGDKLIVDRNDDGNWEEFKPVSDGNFVVDLMSKSIAVFPIVINGPQGDIWQAQLDGSCLTPPIHDFVSARGSDVGSAVLRCFIKLMMGQRVEIPFKLD